MGYKKKKKKVFRWGIGIWCSDSKFVHYPHNLSLTKSQTPPPSYSYYYFFFKYIYIKGEYFVVSLTDNGGIIGEMKQS